MIHNVQGRPSPAPWVGSPGAVAPGNELLNEDGAVLLNEDGTPLLNEE